ncbi:hypothetical protein ACOL3H_11905 [Aliarcobacter butzleri]
MKKNELNNNIKHLLNNVIEKKLEEEIKKLIESGAIDYELEDSKSFATSKVIIKVALENIADSLTLSDKKSTKEYKNLQNF